MANLLEIWEIIKIPVCILVGNIIALFFYLVTPNKAQDIFFNRRDMSIKTRLMFIVMNLGVGEVGGFAILPLVNAYFNFQKSLHQSVAILTGIVSLAVVRALWSTFSGKWLENKMVSSLENGIDKGVALMKNNKESESVPSNSGVTENE